MKDGTGTEKDGEEEKLTYGISRISIKTNIYRIVYVDCDNEQSVNKWELFDINWFNI